MKRDGETRFARLRGYLASGARNRRKIATIGAALLAVEVGYHVVFGPNGIIVYEQKRHETQSLETEMKRLEKENEGLRGHVDRLQNDPGAIEHQARQELHYTRPGEVIYTLAEPPVASDHPKPASQ